MNLPKTTSSFSSWLHWKVQSFEGVSFSGCFSTEKRQSSFSIDGAEARWVQSQTTGGESREADPWRHSREADRWRHSCSGPCSTSIRPTTCRQDGKPPSSCYQLSQQGKRSLQFWHSFIVESCTLVWKGASMLVSASVTPLLSTNGKKK